MSIFDVEPEADNELCQSVGHVEAESSERESPFCANCGESVEGKRE